MNAVPHSLACWRNEANLHYRGNEILGFVFVGEPQCGVKLGERERQFVWWRKLEALLC